MAEDTIEIIRPGIKISMQDNKIEKFNSSNKERTLITRVYFFAKDKNKYRIDNLKMQDILENAFLEDVRVTDTFLMPMTESGLDSTVINSVLEVSFELYSIEEIEDSTVYETMGSLEMNLS